MIVTIIAVLWMASATPVDPPAAPPPAVADAETPLKQAQDNLERAEQIYTQSCANRAYGAYDDICGQLSDQLRQFRIELDRQERAAIKQPAKTSVAKPKS